MNAGTVFSILGRARPKDPPVKLSALRVHGQFFEQVTGDPFTVIENSDFNLLNRWQHKEDIRPILRQRQDIGFNMARVWTAYDIPNIGTFTDIAYERIPEFCALCASYGLRIEFTAYTGINDPDHWEQLSQAAASCDETYRPFEEYLNEADVNTNEPDAAGRAMIYEPFLEPDPERPGQMRYGDPNRDHIYIRLPDGSHHTHGPARDVICSHGSNGSSQYRSVGPYWDYALLHTNGASEEQRKIGHNAMEVWSGPTITNETSRYPDGGGMWRASNALDLAYDAAAGAALLCAGFCFHSAQGKRSDLFDAETRRAAQAMVDGARSVDLNCQRGPYIHAPWLEGPDTLRVYDRPVSGHSCTVFIRK